ncbi:hypothetical protein FRB91_001373 [Serendipita sp. 411]|nr:hypothetical protein FRB91_001373 [Serendipita sp. 411]
MVVLAASIVTKSGKPIISRQFREMPRSRVESLLTSFPKLIPPNSQHTSVETADVRYVYQPLEELYILLITNKASNILQDIDTLHLFARVVSDLCRTAEEKEITKNQFELMGAFDEVVSLGYREPINLTQVRNVLEMESHEEKIQEIIARNKEAEAKEELKRRAKQLEMQRREQQRRAAQGGGVDFGGNSGGFGTISNSGGYSSVPRFETASPVQRTESPQPKPKAPAFKGSGMKLGATKKLKQAEVLDALGGELATPEASRSATPSIPAAAVHSAVLPSSVPSVAREGIHIQINEQISVSLARDGSLKTLDLKGDLQVEIQDKSTGPIRIRLAEPSSSSPGDMQFKQNPKVAKFDPAGERTIALKNASDTFPVGRSLELLRWRLTKKDESYLPLAINCWPTPSDNGSCDVSLDFELENEKLSLYDLRIEIPLPPNRSPNVTTAAGEWEYNPSTNSILWSLPPVAASEDNTSGNLEFNVPGAGDDISVFFPLKVSFTATGGASDMTIATVEEIASGSEVPFSTEVLLKVDEFVVG